MSRAVASMRCSQLSTTSRVGVLLERRHEQLEVVGAAPHLAGSVEDTGLAQVEGPEEGRQDVRGFGHRRQLDHPHRPVALALPLPRDLGGQPGLARATRPDDRAESAGGEQGQQAGLLGLAAKEAVEAGPQDAAAAHCADGGVARPVAQHGGVQLAQGRRRVGAERVGQRLAQPLVCRERLCRAPARSQGPHQLRREALAQGVGPRQVLQLGDQIGHPVLIALDGEQVRLHACSDRFEPLLLEACGHRHGILGPVRVLEGAAAPQRQRVAEHAPGYRRARTSRCSELLTASSRGLAEHERVDVVLSHRQPVATVHLLHEVGVTERPAEPGDERLQGVCRVGRRVVAPDRVDEVGSAHGSARVDGQAHEQTAQARASNLARSVPTSYNQRPEDAHLHGVESLRPLVLVRFALWTPDRGDLA